MTIRVGNRYLRCPVINRVIEHTDCHECKNLIRVRAGPWVGDIGQRRQYVSIECLYKNIRRTTGTLSSEDTERLSNL